MESGMGTGIRKTPANRTRRPEGQVAMEAMLEPWEMIAGWYALWSGISLALYGWDKRAAGRAARRVPESALHCVDLVGGWPGGFVARRMWRHKARKRKFVLVSWGIVAVHVVGWVVVWWAGR